MRLALLLAVALALSGCGNTAMLYCIAVDHDVNKRCH